MADELKQCEQDEMPHEPHEWRDRVASSGGYYCGGVDRREAESNREARRLVSQPTDPADLIRGTGYSDAVQRAVEDSPDEPPFSGVDEDLLKPCVYENGIPVDFEGRVTPVRWKYEVAPDLPQEEPIQFPPFVERPIHVEDEFVQQHIALFQEMDPEAEAVYEIFLRAFRIYLDKKRLYGSAWKELGALGNFVRIHSKVTRIKNIAWGNGRTTVFPENDHPEREETVQDNLLDLMVLCAFMVRNIAEDNWRGK